jgi:hypothetical protein
MATKSRTEKTQMLKVVVSAAIVGAIALVSMSSAEAAHKKRSHLIGMTHYVKQGHYQDIGSQWIGEFSIGVAGACQGGGRVGIDKVFFDGPKPSLRCPNGEQLQRFDPKPGT